MLIKVCGMRLPDNIREVAALGVDWMGFIFYAESPRFVGQINERQLPDAKAAKRIGVFVNASTEDMIETATRCRLDYLQLHGNESPDDCYALQKRGYSLIKVFSVFGREDLVRTADYEGCVDYFLFDTKCNGYGGSGRQFDWSILSAYAGSTPFLLSGGIGPDSVETIRAFNHPKWVGIDLNSGFEIEPARKDVEALHTFIKEIKNNSKR